MWKQERELQSGGQSCEECVTVSKYMNRFAKRLLDLHNHIAKMVLFTLLYPFFFVLLFFWNPDKSTSNKASLHKTHGTIVTLRNNITEGSCSYYYNDGHYRQYESGWGARLARVVWKRQYENTCNDR